MAEWLFDQNGRPQIIEDRDCFRSADGRVIGWISGNSAHSPSGRHVAWYEDRVLYDGATSPSVSVAALLATFRRDQA
jgi:hypothetical protein